MYLSFNNAKFHDLIFPLVISRSVTRAPMFRARAYPETDGPTIVSACFAPRCVNLAAFPRSNDGHSVTDRIFRARSQFTLARWARFPDDGFLDRDDIPPWLQESTNKHWRNVCERERERESDYLHSVTDERTGWTVVTMARYMAKVGEWTWVYKLGIVNHFCRWRSPNGVDNWGEGMNWVGLQVCCNDEISFDEMEERTCWG